MFLVQNTGALLDQHTVTSMDESAEVMLYSAHKAAGGLPTVLAQMERANSTKIMCIRLVLTCIL